VRRVSTVIGGTVQIAGDVSVGRIEDMVISDRGCIEYVVVVYHDNYVAIPWSVTVVDFSRRIVTVDITAERFAAVPTFTRSEFSVLTKTEFTQKVHSAFGGKAGSQASNSKKPEAKPAAAQADQPAAESVVKKSGEKKTDVKNPEAKPAADKPDAPAAVPKKESGEKKAEVKKSEGGRRVRDIRTK